MCLPAVKKRNIKADFDGGNVTSDGGGVLLNLIDQKAEKHSVGQLFLCKSTPLWLTCKL